MKLVKSSTLLTYYLAITILMWSAPATAQSFESFLVRDIRVDGLRRFGPGVIFSRLQVDIGDRLTEEQADDIIDRLFETGFFRSVDVLRDEGGVLVIAVEENPTIAEVDFSGTDELPKEKLEGMLKQAGIVKARVYDPALVDAAAKALKEIYEERSFYQTKVEAVASPLPRNRIALLFNVEEGPQAVIRSITFSGNEQFSLWTLQRQMELETRGLLNYFTDNYLFSESRLKSDLQRIRTLYLEAGYLRFEVESEEVEVSADKRYIDIRIRLKEGGQYTVTDAVFAGDLPPEVAEEDLRELLEQVPGELFSSRAAEETIERIRNLLGDLGYARAKVSYDNELDDGDLKVRVTYNIELGPMVYVRNINIIGNERTRDEVIRRELLQFERERYSYSKINRSISRVRRLGYFTDVKIDENDVEGSADEVDLVVEVKESSVGNFNIGAGFSTDDKVSFKVGLDTPNIFGSGNDFKTNLSWRENDKSLSLNLDEHYHTDEGISRHMGMHLGDRKSGDNISAYDIDNFSVEYGYGVPYSDDGKYFVYLSYERVKIKSAAAYVNFINKHSNKLDLLVLKSGLTYDTRNAAYSPTGGQRVRVDSNLGMPLLDLKYYTLEYNHDYYYDLMRWPSRPVLHLKLGAGVGDSYGGDVFPFYERFFVGGIGTLRGFDSNSVGYAKDADGKLLGGKSRLYGTVEFIVDTKLFDTQKIDLAPYLDVGAVGKEPGGLGSFRMSTGVELRWASPIGPLKFSWGTAIKSKSGDKTQSLQFSVSY